VLILSGELQTKCAVVDIIKFGAFFVTWCVEGLIWDRFSFDGVCKCCVNRVRDKSALELEDRCVESIISIVIISWLQRDLQRSVRSCVLCSERVLKI